VILYYIKNIESNNKLIKKYHLFSVNKKLVGTMSEFNDGDYFLFNLKDKAIGSRASILMTP
jgi:hypothetical protein